MVCRGEQGEFFEDEADFRKYLDEGGVLSEIMKGINLAYAQHYKRKYNHIKMVEDPKDYTWSSYGVYA